MSKSFYLCLSIRRLYGNPLERGRFQAGNVYARRVRIQMRAMNKIGHLVARAALTGSFAASLLLGVAPLHADTGEPAAVVGNFDDTLLVVMGQAKMLGYRGRYDILEPAIDKAFDVPAMTRTAVGPGWAGLSESQRSRLTDAFRRFITATFAVRFDDYGGERFEVQGAKPMTGGVLVENHLVKSNGERVRINYLTHQTANGWGAIDIYLDGTISELAVRRSEFTAVLKQSGPEGLIATLERKTQQLAVN
jgi:phospholipid transport system substrate-binding protein